MRRLSQSDKQYRPYLHMLPWEDSVNQTYNTDPIYIYYPWEDSVNQIYNTDPICICYHEKTRSIRYTIPTLSAYVTKRRLSQSDIQYRPYLHILPMRRLSQSDIQYRPYLHILPMRRLSQSDIQYRPYLHMLPWEDSINQIYNTDPIYIYYHEKTQSIRYTIPTLSTYITMRRLSSSDTQYRPFLHMLPWDDSVNQIYNTDSIYLCLNDKTQFVRYTIPTLSTYATMIRLSRSDIQYRLYLHMLPREDSVNQIYNTDPINIYYPWEDSVNQIYNTTLSTYMTWEISVDQICNATLSTYVTKRRHSRSDIQYRPDLH